MLPDTVAAADDDVTTAVTAGGRRTAELLLGPAADDAWNALLPISVPDGDMAALEPPVAGPVRPGRAAMAAAAAAG